MSLGSWLSGAASDIGGAFKGAAGAAGSVATGGLGGLAGMVPGGVGGLAGMVPGASMLGLGGGSQPQGGGQAGGNPYGTQTGGSSPWPVNPGGPSPNGQTFEGKLNVPGAAEKFQADNASKWSAPSAGSQWWEQNQGKFSGGGPADQYWNGIQGKAGQTPTTANNAQGAYNQFQGSTPADTSSYYNNAVKNATEDVNAAAAGGGTLGSTGAADQARRASTDLRGQQAQADAQYGLSRAGLAGSLASGADVSSGRDVQNQLGWMTGLGGLANQTQNSALQRLLGAGGLAQGFDADRLNGLNSGMGAAVAAENALRNRGQDFFNNNLAMGQAEANPFQQAYLAMLQNDQNLQDNAINMQTGGAREGLNQSVTGRASTEQGLGNLMNMAGGLSKSGGLGGMLGGIL